MTITVIDRLISKLICNKEKEKKADYESQLAGVRERMKELKESKQK